MGITGQLNIIEPLGMSLYERIVMAAEKLGISKYLGFHKTVNYQSIDLNCDIKKMSSNAFKKIKLKGLNKVKKNILKLLN